MKSKQFLVVLLLGIMTIFVLFGCSTLSNTFDTVMKAGGSFNSNRGRHHKGVTVTVKEINRDKYFISVNSRNPSAAMLEWERLAIKYCPNGYYGRAILNSENRIFTVGKVITNVVHYTAVGSVNCQQSLLDK